ncbi:MAG: DUF1573 domain-containing protein [Cyclobacteriaceae bacterium]|jgi:hypothetical protein|nr:DUF1573 domain-containing protein [Cyclobacteriaceae bacterium]
MKKSLWIFGLVLLAMTACKDKDAEKKIAALEARLAEVEGKRAASPISPMATPAEEKPEGPLPLLAFEKTDHDFGTIKEGAKVTHVYKFKNTGEVPLIIEDVRPSCGCTAPEWSKEPVPPGGEGFVKAEFDSSGKPNMQNKTITVVANTWPKQTTLSFKAMVTPKAGAPVQ